MMTSTPGGLLERADVAALAADDPALHFVVGETARRYGGLGGVVGRDPLHDGGEDPPRNAPRRPRLHVARSPVRAVWPPPGLRPRSRWIRAWRASPAGSPPTILELDVSCWARSSATWTFSASTSRHAVPRPVASRRSSASDLPVQRLGSVEEEPFLALEVGPLFACLFFRGALGLEDVVLALQHDLLLLGARLGHHPFGVASAVHHGRGQNAARQVPEDRAHDAGDRSGRRWQGCQASAPPSQELRTSGRPTVGPRSAVRSGRSTYGLCRSVPACTPTGRPGSSGRPTCRRVPMRQAAAIFPMSATISRSCGRKSWNMIRCAPAAARSSIRVARLVRACP